MDCYDEILKISQEDDRKKNYIFNIIDFINKNSTRLTEIEFKNCVILTLAIWNPKSIDSYLSKGIEIRHLDENRRKLIIDLLSALFRM